MRAVVSPRACSRWLVADLARLARVRLEILVLFVTAAGFWMANGGKIEWERFGCVLLGTGLVAASAGALNQVFEFQGDGRMTRTRERPIPLGSVSWWQAAGFGAALAICGLGVLVFKTTPSAAAFAGVALVLYLGVYTPLKTRTPLCVEVGAVAGALPPVIGWAALDGSVSMQTAVLFGILFAWQIPHVTAIAWIHRKDYAAAGIHLLPCGDSDGKRAAERALAFSGLLIVLTLIPSSAPRVGAGCLGVLVLLNAVLLIAAVRFVRKRSLETARGLFMVSIVYLPLLLTLMCLL